ncbi:MAG TPA: hypothetical protein VGA53_00770 [Candidatus Paceibacterota bacterium]
MEKRMFLGIFSLALVASLVTGTSAFAQSMEEGGVQVSVDSVSVEEQAVVLQAISQQLVEIEAEVNRLSLRVSKYVLEQQALALQRQVEALVAAQGSGVASLPPVAIETGESTVIQEAASAPVAQAEVSNELDELPAPIVGSSDDNEDRGFFAGIRNAMGNLGAPELVTVLILAVLAIFVLVRRVTSRDRRKAPGAAPVSPNTPQQEPQGQQALDQQRQDLQERVAWK